MGKPCELSPDDEKQALDLARWVIRSVTNDERFPLIGLSEDGKYQVLILSQALLKYKKMVPNI